MILIFECLNLHFRKERCIIYDAMDETRAKQQFNYFFRTCKEVGDFLSERFASEPVPLAKHIPDIKISNKPKLTHSVYYFNYSQLVPLFFHLIHKVH
jgi:hypothetical protein